MSAARPVAVPDWLREDEIPLWLAVYGRHIAARVPARTAARRASTAVVKQRRKHKEATDGQ